MPKGGRFGGGAANKKIPPGLAKKGGMPPGLAKKGGMPPGLAKKAAPVALPTAAPAAMSKGGKVRGMGAAKRGGKFSKSG